MSLWYRFAYGVGLTPWEQMPSLPAGRQAAALLDRETAERQPPYGKALDIGCGSGIWSVDLAQRGWEVTGLDIIPKALRAARARAQAAGVQVRFVEGDVTALRAAGLDSGFRLVLDFGTVHGLSEAQREAAGREVTAVTAEDATVLMYAFSPAWRGLLPRGASRADIEAAYPGWTVVAEEPLDVTGAPFFVKKATPRWYRLRRT